MGLLQPHSEMSIGISFATDDDDMTQFVAKKRPDFKVDRE
jgi:hypothetical protein